MSQTTKIASSGGSPDISKIYNPFISPQLDDPYPVYARARREAPVFYSEVLDMWIVSRYEDVCAVYRDPALFSSADVLKAPHEPSPEARQELIKEGYVRTPLTVDNDPPAHTRVRSGLGKSFTPGLASRLEPSIRAIANELVDAFARDGRVELIERFAHPLPLLVVLRLLGLPQQDAEQIKKWSDAWAAFMWAPPSPAQQMECARSMVAYLRYCQRVVEQKRSSPGDDLLSHLIQARSAGEAALSDMELALMVNDLIFAGHKTTANAIANTVNLLLTRRERWRVLRADPSLLPAAIEEALRLDPPVQCSVRTATADAQLAGIAVDKGARVCLLIGSAQRDEACFQDPDAFDLRRQGHEKLLAFGNGIHFCVGARLARLTSRVALEVLGERLPDLHLVEGQPLVYSPSMLLRALTRLELAWSAAS